MGDPVPEFDEALMPPEQPPELGDLVLDERHMAYARARWPDQSQRMQEYRVRQAIWVRFEHRKPHPEDPNRAKIGGVQPGSGPKIQKRIGEAIVDAAEGRQKEIVDAIFAPLSIGNDAMDRHKAGMNIAKHAREERAMEIVEDEYARKSEDEVKLDFAKAVVDMLRSGELKPEDIFEGTASEVVEETRQLPAA